MTAQRKPIIDTEVTRPVPPTEVYGKNAEPDLPDALKHLEAAGQTASIVTPVSADNSPKAKPKKTIDTVKVAVRLTPNQRAWVRIAAAQKNIGMEDFLRFCLTCGLAEGGLVDEAGQSIVIENPLKAYA